MKVVNIVLTGKFSKNIDLYSLPNAVYRPHKFSGAVCDYNGCTFLLFANGKFVCLGAKKKMTGLAAFRSFAKKLGSKILNCSIKNMVMAHNLKYNVDIKRLYNELRKEGKVVIFDDELFSDIVLKEGMETDRLFHTGNFFITGLCTLKLLTSICKLVIKKCQYYKKL